MIPIAKSIKRYFSLKEIIIICLVVLLSVFAGIGAYTYLKKDVVVNDNGKQYTLKTMKYTVSEVLQQNGIKVGKYDNISVPLDAKLQRMKLNTINIKRAVPVTILADGVERNVMTCKDTVSEVLGESSVKMNNGDKLDGIKLGDSIKKGMFINLIRVNEKLLTDKTAIPFKVITRPNNSMDKGKERIVSQGKEGLREKVFKVIYENGKEVARQLVSDAIASNPINKVVEYGTILTHTNSRGDVIRYKKVLSMRATAYTSSYADTGKRPGDPQFGITATGRKAKKGIIAVDPRVIPLGTRVYVEVAGKTPDYGYAVAGDTGGAIKGDLIDLYYDSHSTVENWGVKRVKVYVLYD